MTFGKQQEVVAGGHQCNRVTRDFLKQSSNLFFLYVFAINKNISFCVFLFAKTYILIVCSLQTKSDIQPTTFTVTHHINIQTDEHF